MTAFQTLNFASVDRYFETLDENITERKPSAVTSLIEDKLPIVLNEMIAQAVAVAGVFPNVHPERLSPFIVQIKERVHHLFHSRISQIEMPWTDITFHIENSCYFGTIKIITKRLDPQSLKERQYWAVLRLIKSLEPSCFASCQPLYNATFTHDYHIAREFYHKTASSFKTKVFVEMNRLARAAQALKSLNDRIQLHLNLALYNSTRFSIVEGGEKRAAVPILFIERMFDLSRKAAIVQYLLRATVKKFVFLAIHLSPLMNIEPIDTARRTLTIPQH